MLSVDKYRIMQYNKNTDTTVCITHGVDRFERFAEIVWLKLDRLFSDGDGLICFYSKNYEKYNHTKDCL